MFNEKALARIAHAINSVETLSCHEEVNPQARIAHAINSVETNALQMNFIFMMRVLRMLLIALKQPHINTNWSFVRVLRMLLIALKPYLLSMSAPVEARIAHAINSVETNRTLQYPVRNGAYCACY